MSNCKECLSEEVCRYNDGINLYCKEDYECPHFKNKAVFVKVAFCKDCKHRGTMYCAFDPTIVSTDDDFCSCGEEERGT